MKKQILLITNELFFALEEEIKEVLRELFGGLKNKTFESNIEELENEMALYKVLSHENSEFTVGYVAGDSESGEDFNIKKILLEKGYSRRDPSVINWELFSSRLKDHLLSELETLKEDISKQYEEPKTLEMRYFDLSIKYHQLYRFLFENYNTDILSPIRESLYETRNMLSKLEFQ
jgi:hypothetical protein